MSDTVKETVVFETLFHEDDSSCAENDSSFTDWGERILRSYIRMAHYHHMCSYCGKYIDPGDVYEGVVYVTSSPVVVDGEEKYFFVRKHHLAPECPDKQKRYLEESLLERERMQKASRDGLKKAA